MNPQHHPSGDKTVGRQLQRFAVEALCLLMLFYGAPLQALESALPTVEVEASDLLFEVDAILESAGQDLQTNLQTGFQAAWQVADNGVSSLVQQPWADALAMMLTASSFGVTQESGSPPSPPSDARSSKDYDLDSLAKGFSEKNTVDAIPLLPGWNQVSLPEVPGTPDPGTILAAIGGSYSKVYAYDGCHAADPWKVYDPADPADSDLTTIGVEQGLVIDATAAVSLPSDGTLPDSTTFQLCTGWNLIGFPSAQPRHVRSALAPIMDKVVRVFGFDPFDADDPWAFFEKDAPAWASDLDTMEPGQGYWILVTEDVQLEIKNVGEVPDIAFTSPLDLDVVTAPTEIQGSVASDLLESWQLRFRGVGELDWIDLASGNYPVLGKLGDFDPTLLLNGMYEIELTATDLQGLQVTDSITVVVEGNMKIGHFTLSFVDLAIPLSGLDIEVVRTYDSRQRHLQGDFGYGWSLEIRQGSYRNNRPPGDGWVIHDTQGPWGLPCSPDAVQPTKSHLTTIRLSDQEVYRFELVVEDPGTIIGGCIGRADFKFINGPIPGATLEILGNTSVLYQNNSFELRDPNSFALYEPEDVKLTTRDGRIFHLNLADGVTHLEDLNGNTLDITPEGITHSSGLSIDFTRDSEGRVSNIIDTEGQAIEYSYSDESDLSTTTDQGNSEIRYTYNEDHFLREVIDALGLSQIQLEYQSTGRMASMTDAIGRRTTTEHQLQNRREIIRDRNGRFQTLEYDQRGNVVRVTDRLNRVISRTFDTRDRMLTQTIGETTTSLEYNAFGDVTKITDPLGNSTEFTYDDRGNMLTLKDPRNNMTLRTFDLKGNLTSTTNADGGTSYYTYNPQGDLASITDGENYKTEFLHDHFGRVKEVINALGHTTTFVRNSRGQLTQSIRYRTSGEAQETLATSFLYDRAGRLIQRQDPDGSGIQMSYGPTGLLEARRDKRGNNTQFEYDARGLPLKTIYSDGSSAERIYNDDGQLQSLRNRDSNWSHFNYNAENELVAVTHPDGSISQVTYDAKGRVSQRIDGLGNVVSFEYDAADQLTKTIGASGWEETNVYDAMGNIVEVQTPDGRIEQYEYDAGNRVLSHSIQSTPQASNAYDARGFVVSQTRPNGSQTSLARDPLGRLTTIVDALGNTSSILYDEVGNRIRQVDAAGNVTRFEYDRMGRKTRQILPDDTVFSFEYDEAGNLINQHRPDGTTIQISYDSNNRVIERKIGSRILAEIEYEPSGRLLKARNENGEITRSYDSRGRLQKVTFTNGTSVDYTYDLAGNRTSISVGDRSTQYEYDSDNRLERIIAPGGLDFQYSYNASGRRTSLVYPNSTSSTYSYDHLGRLQQISTYSPEGTVLHREAYERDLNGNLTTVTELGSHRKMYTYDVLDRLVEEKILEGSVEILSRSYSYDPAGNRSEMAETSEAGTLMTTYEYDARGRLVGDSHGNSFQWSPLGRLTRKDSSRTEFQWSPDGQLTQVSTEAESRNYVYDTGGRRIGASTDLISGEEMETDFLLDISSPIHSILAEASADPSLDRYHVRDSGLLATLGAAGVTYHHTDSLGTVRLRTDENGEVVDRLSYTAFGEVFSATSDSAIPGFVGEAYSSTTGQYDLRARWYDPNLGRFLSADPFPGFQSKPSTWNKYSYVENNPVNRMDPLGLFTASQQGIAATALGLLNITVGLNLLTTYGAFQLAEASDGSFDGFLVNGRLNIHGRGGTIGSGLDLAADFKTLQFWVGGTLEVGLYPLSLWKSTNGRGGGSLTVGPIFGMESPRELAGRGSSAVWPLSVLRLMPRGLFSRGRAWGVLSQLAKRDKRGSGTSVQIGFSTSGPSYFMLGPRSNDFSSLGTYSTEFVPIQELPAALSEGLAETAESLSALFSLGPEIELLLEKPEVFFDLLFRGLPQ